MDGIAYQLEMFSYHLYFFLLMYCITCTYRLYVTWFCKTDQNVILILVLREIPISNIQTTVIFLCKIVAKVAMLDLQLN